MGNTYGTVATPTFDYYGILKGGTLGTSSDLGDFSAGGVQGGTELDGTDSSWMSSLGGIDGIRGISSLGGLALGGLSYFENKKNAKLQRRLAQQQIESNAYLLDREKKGNAAIVAAFSNPGGTPAQTSPTAAVTAPPTGLAAQSQAQAQPNKTSTFAPRPVV